MVILTPRYTQKCDHNIGALREGALVLIMGTIGRNLQGIYSVIRFSYRLCVNCKCTPRKITEEAFLFVLDFAVAWKEGNVQNCDHNISALKEGVSDHYAWEGRGIRE